jgi:hypothetical protein
VRGKTLEDLKNPKVVTGVKPGKDVRRSKSSNPLNPGMGGAKAGGGKPVLSGLPVRKQRRGRKPRRGAGNGGKLGLVPDARK